MSETWLLVGVIVVIALLALKIRSQGTMCKVSRDLTGQVAIITGGNTGIGRETALGLAKRNCTVVIAARDVAKSQQAVQYIKENSNNQNVEQYPLDLSKRESINQFANTIKTKYNKINILINNAGISAIPELTVNSEGIEMQIATNHFGHFYLTSLLWGLLRNFPDLRIINVSSRAHKRRIFDRNKKVQIEFDNLDGTKDYGPYKQYSTSKLANVLFTQELAERITTINQNARILAVHPGVVRTEVARYVLVGWKKFAAILVYPILALITKDCTHGAQTTLYTVFEKAENLKNGGYYDECKLAEVNPFALDAKNQKLLWQKTQERMNIKFFAS